MIGSGQRGGDCISVIQVHQIKLNSQERNDRSDTEYKSRHKERNADRSTIPDH